MSLNHSQAVAASLFDESTATNDAQRQVIRARHFALRLLPFANGQESVLFLSEEDRAGAQALVDLLREYDLAAVRRQERNRSNARQPGAGRPRTENETDLSHWALYKRARAVEADDPAEALRLRALAQEKQTAYLAQRRAKS